VPFLLGFKIRKSHFLKVQKKRKIHLKNTSKKRGSKTAQNCKKHSKSGGPNADTSLRKTKVNVATTTYIFHRNPSFTTARAVSPPPILGSTAIFTSCCPHYYIVHAQEHFYLGPKPSKSSKPPKMHRNIGSNEDPRGIDGRHLSDTNNFIRGLHAEYLISRGQTNQQSWWQCPGGEASNPSRKISSGVALRMDRRSNRDHLRRKPPMTHKCHDVSRSEKGG
jgi:hypothetical protein